MDKRLRPTSQCAHNVTTRDCGGCRGHIDNTFGGEPSLEQEGRCDQEIKCDPSWNRSRKLEQAKRKNWWRVWLCVRNVRACVWTERCLSNGAHPALSPLSSAALIAPHQNAVLRWGKVDISRQRISCQALFLDVIAEKADLWPGIHASGEFAAAQEQRIGCKAVTRNSGVCFGIGGAGAVRSSRTTPQSSRVCIRSPGARKRTSWSETVVWARKV